MLRTFVLCTGVLLLLTVDPCSVDPGRDLLDVPSPPSQPSPPDQLDSASRVTVNVLKTAKPQANAGTPTEALLAAIAAWLSTSFGMPLIEDHPRVSLVPSTQLAALRFDPSLPKPASQVASIERTTSPYREHDVVALYDDVTRTIYLQTGWTGATPADLSVLVHEMVHHIQNAAGLKYECPEAREKLAFAAQEQWLGMFGSDLMIDFAIDPFTLLVRTSCLY